MFGGFRDCFSLSALAGSAVTSEEYRIVIGWRAYRDTLEALNREAIVGTCSAERKAELVGRVAFAWKLMCEIATPPGLEAAEIAYQQAEAANAEEG